MVRVRGCVFTTWDVGMLAGIGGQAKVAVAYNIQLTPVRDGALDPGAILDPRNAADMESNRIMWRYTALPDFYNQEGSQVDTNRIYADKEIIDVKVQRRWDRATWGLVMVQTFDTVDEVEIEQILEMRALFKSTDGV